MTTTKELIEYVKSLDEILKEDDNLRSAMRDEIIQKLRELNDLRKACRELLRGVRASGVGQLVQTFYILSPKNHDKK